MLVRTPALGVALAESLGQHSLALMRGHGNVVVAADIKAAVYRAIYCEVNARLQLQSLQLDPKPRYLSETEAAQSDATNMKVIARPWRYWAERAGCADLRAALAERFPADAPFADARTAPVIDA